MCFDVGPHSRDSAQVIHPTAVGQLMYQVSEDWSAHPRSQFSLRLTFVKPRRHKGTKSSSTLQVEARFKVSLRRKTLGVFVS